MVPSLRNAHGLRANFRDADLVQADCLGADFSHADLRATDIASATFCNAALQATRWAGVNHAAQADWHAADLARATAPGQEADFPAPLLAVPPLPAWLLQTGHTSDITAVAWLPDGSTLLTGSNDQTARLWEAASGVCLRILMSCGGGWVSLTPDGKAAGSGAGLEALTYYDPAEIAVAPTQWLAADLPEWCEAVPVSSVG